MKLGIGVLLLAMVVGCDGNAADDAGIARDAGGDVDAAAVDAGPGLDASGVDASVDPDGWSFEVFEERTVPLEGRMVAVELIRAHRPDGGVSYLLYFPAPSPNAPVAVLTEPYAGVDWTGESVDARWAALGDGLHDDVDAPDWDGDDQIAYGAQSIEQAASASNIFLLHGVAAVRAYGRFYAGGDLADDLMDSAAPYFFVRSRAGELDLSHIGAYGGSWGGMMVIYGAALAPDEAVPRAAVALAPPSDFADMWRWIAEDLPAVYPDPTEAERFFSPYRRRIEAAAGGPPGVGDYAPFSYDALCAGLRAPVVLPHDQHDVLVTVRQTEGFVTACGAQLEPLYWHRQAPLDYAAVGMSHGVFDDAPGVATALTFAVVHLLLELLPDASPVYTVADAAPLEGFLATVRAEQLAGGDAADALPRLRELADARVQAFASDSSVAPGAERLADAVNAVYGTTHDADSIRAALATGLPTP
ncbi:MAG: hypothetical protein H6719_36115 [Sandaracinaceae bacterium]|nr:hypothetical protein [Sandaracinaceae bacterium]